MRKLAIGLAAAALAGVCVFPAAAYASSSRTVQLYTDQTSAVSGVVGNYHTGKATTLNEGYSVWSVYGILQYAAPGKGWSEKGSSLVARGAGGSCTSYQSTAGSWRMELNPWGWLTSGCRAHGTVTGS